LFIITLHFHFLAIALRLLYSASPVLAFYSTIPLLDFSITWRFTVTFETDFNYQPVTLKADWLNALLFRVAEGDSRWWNDAFHLLEPYSRMQINALNEAWKFVIGLTSNLCWTTTQFFTRHFARLQHLEIEPNIFLQRAESYDVSRNSTGKAVDKVMVDVPCGLISPLHVSTWDHYWSRRVD
jgi:hypothetical protein